MEMRRYPRQRLRAALVAVLSTAALTAPAPAHAQSTDPAVVGQWSQVIPWPIVAIHATLLPSGKVLAWPRDGGNQAILWDPVSNAFTAVPLSGTDLFCAGHTLLDNGRLLTVGGVIVGPSGEQDGFGENKTNIFNPGNNTWSKQPNMNAGRWYPTACALGNGEVVVVAGTISPAAGTNLVPQVWQIGGGWRDLKRAQLLLSTYPMLHLAPNGKVFNAGPDVVSRYLDTASNGTWSVVDDRASGGIYRDYGSSVLYDNGKVLLMGGHDPPTPTAEVIDLNQAAPRWRRVAPMAYARRQHNSLLLPSGKVLVTGGTSGGGFNDPCDALLPRTPEEWDPVTETFTPMAGAAEIRIYHSVSLLLPDGRVLSAGGGQVAGDPNPACPRDADHSNAEIYSPPYLFRGPRPTIQSAPAAVTYGDPFTVRTPNAASIAQVTWVRLSSVTHSFNQNQRINRLSFTRTATGLTVTAPSDKFLCPPGHYMLFLLDGSGVPSVSKIVAIR